jgi:hypothetical protein
MLYQLDGAIMSDGSLGWGIYEGGRWEEEDGVKLSFSLSSKNRREATKELVSAIAKENLSWITYTRNKWDLDLDKFKEFIALIFGADTLIHIPWEWFKGKVSIEPEYESKERSDFGKSRYETRFDFYIVQEVSEEQKVEPEAEDYVDKERIKELQSLEKPKYDTAMLVKLCEELNQNYKWKNYFAVGALLRTILHHVPPIFEMNKFEHVASNYGWGQSDKKSIMRLHQSAKNIADNLLHKQIRHKESLPKKTQVNFAPELDVLLEEIVIKLKS